MDQTRQSKDGSKQPRFANTDPGDFYSSVLSWIGFAAQGQNDPPYIADTRKRDRWLADFWHLEPHLAGMLHSVVSIDANRGWSLVGGRNQVLRYTKVLHNWQVAPGLYGWRPGCSAAALSFYTSDLGGVVEVGREGKDGPVRGFFHTDPTNCKLTASMEFPLKYYPSRGKSQDWAEGDFMRMASMPSVLESYNGAAFCAVSRALELSKLMVAIFQHDSEELGAKAPRGLLLLQGISEASWDNALKGRELKMEGEGYQYFDAVMVLASEGLESTDAKLVALSNLPANFDLQTWVNLLMYGYALCVGYDPGEFYPVQYGSLGRGTEGEVQHRKATAKGAMNFVLALQEQLQRPDILPEALSFEFEQRDEEGEIMEAQKQKAWVDVYTAMREAGSTQGEGAITREEMRILLAEREIIPQEWTVTEEPSMATDTNNAESQRQRRITRDRLLANERIWHVIQTMPAEPIFRYRSKTNRCDVLWRRAEDLLTQVHFPAAKTKKRQGDDILFSNGDLIITAQDVDRAIADAAKRVGPDFAAAIGNPPLTSEEADILDKK